MVRTGYLKYVLQTMYVWMPKFDKRLWVRSFATLLCRARAGCVLRIMKQFSVILVVHCLKGYLIAFLYFVILVKT